MKDDAEISKLIAELLERQRQEWELSKDILDNIDIGHVEAELKEINEESGFSVADDKYSRDFLEAFSEFFDIDFEKLRKLDIAAADLLCEYFFRDAPYDKIREANQMLSNFVN